MSGGALIIMGVNGMGPFKDIFGPFGLRPSSQDTSAPNTPPQSKSVQPAYAFLDDIPCSISTCEKCINGFCHSNLHGIKPNARSYLSCRQFEFFMNRTVSPKGEISKSDAHAW